jgi:hypothetical protein
MITFAFTNGYLQTFCHTFAARVGQLNESVLLYIFRCLYSVYLFVFLYARDCHLISPDKLPFAQPELDFGKHSYMSISFIQLTDSCF